MYLRCFPPIFDVSLIYLLGEVSVHFASCGEGVNVLRASSNAIGVFSASKSWVWDGRKMISFPNQESPVFSVESYIIILTYKSETT
jgi:hypothetical protein